jgi:DnaJ-class molecular chaperone
MALKPKRLTCTNCDGDGWVQGDGVDCSRCNGNGWVDGFFGEKTCSTCSGHGKVYSRETCSNCDGNGYVVVMVEPYQNDDTVISEGGGDPINVD